MNKIVAGIAGLMFFMTALVMGPVFADENEVVELRNEVKELNNKLAALQGQMTSMQGHISSTAGKEATSGYIVPSGQEMPAGVVHTLEDIHMGGYIDTTYGWNFHNSPHSTPTGTTVDRNQSIRVFDTLSNSFMLNAAELDFEKTAAKEGGVGFRTDILMGENAKVINAGGSEADEFDLQQAYIEANLPLKGLEGNDIFGDVVNLKAGKYVTLSGAEVIESRDNWNTSRSLMFGFAIPFTHTGIRSTYGLFKDKVKVAFGLNNGWDLLEDNNKWKTIESQISWSPNDSWTFSATDYFGPENTKTEGHKRNLLDLVALWRVTDKLSLMANADFGSERRVLAVAIPKAGDNAQWYGYALYARYQLTDKWAMAGRTEWFVDDDTFRITAGSTFNGATTEHDYWEYTYTNEYKLYDNLISRIEYRYDWADAPIFGGESHQNTLGGELIYNFG